VNELQRLAQFHQEQNYFEEEIQTKILIIATLP
jgi:hypothetical protein